MKQIQFCLALCIIIINVHGQQSIFKGNNKLKPENLIVNYAVNFDSTITEVDPAIVYDSNSSYRLFIEYPGSLIYDKTTAGKSVVYSVNDQDAYFPYSILDLRKKVSLDDLPELFGVKKAVEYENGEVSLIRHVFSPTEIKGLEFVEEWDWNRETDIFQKKVIAYNPVRVYDDFERVVYKRTFYVIDTCYPKICETRKQVLLAKVRYEFFIDKEWCDENKLLYAKTSMPFLYNASGWNRSVQTFFVHQLCNPVIDGTKEVFDFSTDQKLSHSQALLRMGFETDTVQVMDAETGLMKLVAVQNDFEPERVKSVIFFEDWYIDEDNLLISKLVTGIAPVLFTQGENVEAVKKLVPFVILFNSIK